MSFASVLVSPSALPRFWIFMYRASPVTYIVSTLLSATIGDKKATCSSTELLTFDPPSGTTCMAYLASYLEATPGGRLLNPQSTTQCEYCIVTNTNAVLARFGIAFENRWWHWGASMSYSAFNVGLAMFLYWVLRVRKVKRQKKVGDENRYGEK